jgi:hypothetical protein
MLQVDVDEDVQDGGQQGQGVVEPVGGLVFAAVGAMWQCDGVLVECVCLCCGTTWLSGSELRHSRSSKWKRNMGTGLPKRRRRRVKVIRRLVFPPNPCVSQPTSIFIHPPYTLHAALSPCHRGVVCGATSSDHRPPSTKHQAPTTNHQPPTTNYQLPTTNHQPPTTNHQPPTTNHKAPPPTPSNHPCLCHMRTAHYCVFHMLSSGLLLLLVMVISLAEQRSNGRGHIGCPLNYPTLY